MNLDLNVFNPAREKGLGMRRARGPLKNWGRLSVSSSFLVPLNQPGLLLHCIIIISSSQHLHICRTISNPDPGHTHGPKFSNPSRQHTTQQQNNKRKEKGKQQEPRTDSWWRLLRYSSHFDLRHVGVYDVFVWKKQKKKKKQIRQLLPLMPLIDHFGVLGSRHGSVKRLDVGRGERLGFLLGPSKKT